MEGRATFGERFVLFLDNAKHVWGMGSNVLGQLGESNIVPEEVKPLPSYLAFLLPKNFFSTPNNDPNVRLEPHLNPHLQNITCVASGNSHSLCLDENGLVWGFGDNSRSQLGFNGLECHFTPKTIPGLTDITQVKCSLDGSFAIEGNGNVWAFGHNPYGQLGVSSSKVVPIPTLVPQLTDIVMVACGESHSLFLTERGTVISCGSNEYCQLGCDSTGEPTEIPGLAGIISIAASKTYSLVLNESGEVFTFGYAAFVRRHSSPKMLEDIPIIQEVHASDEWCLLLTTDRKIIWKTLHSPPRAPMSWDTVVGVSCSPYNSLIQAADGTIWLYGVNQGRKLGSNADCDSTLALVQISEYHANLFAVRAQNIKSARK